jgi:flagellar basal-body rod modification protein FlgD
LLVAQVKNQDPLNPTDGVQFLSQLAQFSELEQLIAMRSDVQEIAAALKPVETTTGETNV